VDFLHENIHRKLVLVSAAAGYGKTALLVEFVSQTDYPVAWLRLDDSDRDLVALITDLANALHTRFPGYESDVPRLAASPTATPAELATAMAREFDSALEDYFVLVLDDFHLVDSVPANSVFFNALLARLPDQAHLVMAGRTLPPLRFPQLAAKNQVAGLSEEHLRFRPNEVQALLKQRNQTELPPDAAESLVANTEGWITGILLTTHLMWQGLMAHLIEARQSESPLFDYLATEVLDQQTEPLRQFLLESAVLPEMEPETVDKILGRTDSGHLLHMANNSRLFINAVGEEFRVYQYHHLFRDFLQERLRAQDAARMRLLQTRTAEWYLANGMPEAAVTYFVLAAELHQAARVAEEQAAAMFKAGRQATLRRWAEQLAAVAEAAPRLHLYLATADIDSGEMKKAEAELAVAVAGYTRRADQTGLLEVGLRRTWALIRKNQFPPALESALAAAEEARAQHLAASEALALRYAGECHVAMGEGAEAQGVLQSAVALLENTDSRYDLALTLGDLANAHRLRGQTTPASEAQRQALTIMRAEAAVGPLANLLNDTGWDLHMLGQYEGALATYAEALDWARRGGMANAEMAVLAGQADVLADLGEIERANELYREALSKADAGGGWTLIVYLHCALARQDRRTRNFVGALEWLRRAEAVAQGRRMSLPLANVGSLRGIVLVEMGRVDEGRALLIDVCAALEHAETPVDHSQALFFCARADFAAGDYEASATHLAQALAVAERVGYDQMLLSEAARGADLLQAAAAHQELAPRVAALLARAISLGGVAARLAERGIISPAPRTAVERQTGLLVRGLGPTQVLRDGREIPKASWGSARPRELLFYLVDNMPVARDQVLNTFWPDMPQARAVANLHQTLWRMRKAIGTEVITLDENGFRHAPGLIIHSDVIQFEALGRAAVGFSHSDLRRLGALESAVTLYTGEYLADISADWAADRRRSLSELFVRLLSDYADELLALTRYSDAREALTRALAVEPLRDELHGRMLVCLAALGRRFEVVDYYRRYRDTLRSELGLDPPANIRSLYSTLIT
jgi:LuxR family maltose regulon positive regulatory protein